MITTPRSERSLRRARALGLVAALSVAACGSKASVSSPPASSDAGTSPSATTVVEPPTPSAGAGAVEGSALVASGTKLAWRYHYDRNALGGARVLRDGAIVAVSRSGELLRFAPGSLALEAERAAGPAARALALGPDGALFAALEDGALVAVDDKTLATRPVAALGGTAEWLGVDRAGAVAVVRVAGVVAGRPSVRLEVVDVATGRRHALEQLAPSAFLLDARRRLWLGVDAGEWGGKLARLDLGSGELVQLRGQVDGVYGFFQRGADVMAHGGMLHLGLAQGYVARCGETAVELVASFDRSGAAAGADRPVGPITEVLGEPGGTFLALGYDAVWRADAAFTRFDRVAGLSFRHRPGRPDAMGSYPAVRSAARLDDGSLLVATGRDGLVRIAPDGDLASSRLAGQLEAAWLGSIALGRGTALWSDDPDGAPWRLRDGRWSQVPVYPPAAPAGEAWYARACFLAPDGSRLCVVATNSTPGLRQVLRWREGVAAPEVLVSEPRGTLSPAEAFVTPDGVLWRADELALGRLEGGAWVAAGTVPDKYLWGLRPVGADGAGHVLLLAPRQQKLLALTPGQGLAFAAVADGGGPLAVADAVAAPGGGLVLATDRGLRALPAAGGRAEAGPADVGEVSLSALTRDGRGRLWVGGAGLWLHDPATGKLHELAGALGHRGVVALAPDPDDPDGVLASFGASGAALRATAP
ncbi:MAG: hypothetical protein HY908_19755 [Myxococcales bacterium]|nr:hypothetical protein [Myxococcales bacterium]